MAEGARAISLTGLPDAPTAEALTQPYDPDDPVMKAAFEAGRLAARAELTRVGVVPAGISGVATASVANHVRWVSTGMVLGYSFVEDFE